MSTRRPQNEREAGRDVRPLRRVQGRLGLVVGLMLIALAWFFLLPPAVGGKTSLLVTEGISMEPLLHQNDLAVVRKQSHYEVGQVVMYYSDTLRVKVLHRIVDISDDGTITTKGDNNTWLDEDHPTLRQLDGKMIHRFAGGGKYILLLHSPIVGILGLTILGATVGGLYSLETRKRKNGVSKSKLSEDRESIPVEPKQKQYSWKLPKQPLGMVAGVFTVVGVIVLSSSLFAGLIAYMTPTKVKDGLAMYNLKGSFGYSGRASGENVQVIYPDSQLSTGDPIYLNLVDQMLLSFDFKVESSTKYAGGGTIGMEMDVVGQTGWKHTISLVQPMRFDGDHQRIAAVVSLKDVTKMIRDVQALTKLSEKSFTITFRPDVKLNGTLDGSTAFNQTFTPQLSMSGNDLQLKANGAPAAPTTQPKGSEIAPTGVLQGLTPSYGSKMTLKGGGPTKWGPVRISYIRVLSILGILIGAALLVGAYAAWRKEPTDGDDTTSPVVVEDDVPHEKFKHLIVPITGIAQAGTLATIVDVPTLPTLVKVAESNDALILHELAGDVTNYLVNAAGTTYRFTHRTQSSSATRPRFGIEESAQDVTP
jgi:signal peptidase